MHLEYSYFVYYEAKDGVGNTLIVVNKRIKKMVHIKMIEEFIKGSTGDAIAVANYKLLSVKLKFK